MQRAETRSRNLRDARSVWQRPSARARIREKQGACPRRGSERRPRKRSVSQVGNLGTGHFGAVLPCFPDATGTPPGD